MTAERIDIQPTSGHTCGCGGHDEAEPVLDVRSIPHAVRHAAVIGAFGAIAPGGSMVLVAPHLPRPLIAQLQDLTPVQVDVLTDGPDTWRVRLTRLPSV